VTLNFGFCLSEGVLGRAVGRPGGQSFCWKLCSRWEAGRELSAPAGIPTQQNQQQSGEAAAVTVTGDQATCCCF
jgi:hypothetical protein